MVWDWWGHSALFLLTLKLDHFERLLAKRTDGMDLDDMASLFFCGDIRSKWKDEMKRRNGWRRSCRKTFGSN